MTIDSIHHQSIFSHDLEAYQTSRKAVSNRMYTVLHGLVILLTICSITIAGAYAWGLGEAIPQSIILTLTAIGIEIALVFFSSVMYPRVIMSFFGLLAGVGVLLVSILTITSFLLSQQHEQEHSVLRSKNEYREALLKDKQKLDISNHRDRGTIGIINTRIEVLDREISLLKAKSPETKSTAIYHYVAKTLNQPVEAVSLAFRAIYALIVVCTAVALAGYLETIYSPRSINSWIQSYNEGVAITKNGELKHLELTSQEPARKLIEADNQRYRRSIRDDSVVSSSLYSKVRKEVDRIESGQPVPVRNVKKITKKTDLAYGAIDRLINERLIEQNQAGRYIKV